MRTGFFGGAFNPPHNGHLSLCINAAEQLKLDRLILIPGDRPPHKTIEKNVSFQFRFLLTKIAFEKELTPEPPEIPDADIPENDWNEFYGLYQRYRNELLSDFFSISSAESETAHSKNYSLLILKKLINSSDENFLIIGNDQAAAFDTWHQPNEILKICRVAAFSRNRSVPEKIRRLYPEIQNLNIPMLDISSSMIRKRFQHGLTNSHLLPPMLNVFFRTAGKTCQIYRKKDPSPE